MSIILSLLANIETKISKRSLKQLSHVIMGMLSGTGRVTMLGISRWTEKGGSYRTIQRFYNSIIPWMEIQWQFLRVCFIKAEGEYILAGDETVVSKSGKETYGIDRFFSGLQKRVIRSISFFSFSLIDVKKGCSYPLQINQIIKSAEEKAASKAKREAAKSKPKRKRGRPKGSKNKINQEDKLNPELERIQTWLKTVLDLVGSRIQLKYVALDGHFGNHPSAKMVQELGLELISKMRSDASLFLQFDGEQKKRGRPKEYGEKIDLSNPPERYQKTTKTEGVLQTTTYQGLFLNKQFSDPINVVIIVKTNTNTQRKSHVVLFSTDPDLDHERLVRFYSLRFQIEFNFRDAKQYWGLEDFMNINEVPVTNAANLSLFMVNFSFALMQSSRESDPDYSVLDLKAQFRGLRYASELINILPNRPDNILLHRIFEQIARLGAIHPVSSHIHSP